MSLGTDGSVSIWNAELALKRVSSNDFKEDLVSHSLYDEWIRHCNGDLRKASFFDHSTSTFTESTTAAAGNSSTLYPTEPSLYKILENAISF